MKLILDEWIVREVIDTLYMARTTLLGLTGLDSPQEVAKKSANETAITRRISKTIDIIQQSDEQQPIPESLEEAAEEYALLFEDDNKWKDGGKYKGFIAGAEWQAKQGYSLEYIIQYALGVSDTSTESKKATLSFPLPADIFDGDKVIIQIRKK